MKREGFMKTPFLPLAALLTLVFAGAWWSPSFVLPASLLVIAGLALVWAAASLRPWAGAGCALLLLLLCAVFAPPEFHLWGDGALRLRNLEEGFSALRAAPLESGDYLARRLLMGTGLSPEDTYRVTGIAGGALYLWGLLLAVGAAENSRNRAAMFVLGVTPAWVVFFTGYVESYALVAGLFSLHTGLIIRKRGSLPVALTALLTSAVHLVGLALLPGTAIYALGKPRGRKRTTAIVLIALSAALVSIPLLSGSGNALPDLLGLSVLPQRLALILFAVPVLPFIFPVRKPPLPLVITGSICLAGLLFFPLERGEAIDWDLGAVFILPVFLLFLGGASRRVLPAAAAVSIILAGPRIGVFLDNEASEARYETVLESSTDPAALEEMAIILRDRGNLQEAADLLEEAFRLSGNGRHLAMLSEVHRMAGRNEMALEAAGRAVELRPGLETAWLQLALAAREAGDPQEAFRAALGHRENFPENTRGLWSLSLETAVNAGDPELAWGSAEPLLLLDTHETPVLINLAGAAYLTGRMEAAALFLEEAAASSPNDPLVLFNQGLVALELGNTRAAREYLEKALEIQPGLTAARELLGTIR